MQSLLQKRALNAGAAGKIRSNDRPMPARVCKRTAPVRSGRAPRRAALECEAFFNFFTPKPAAPVSLIDPRAKPLVEQLISLSTGTDAGAKASPAEKEEIAAVVTELSRYCIKNPLKSDLLFGEWKVLFSSKPTAVGGPLRSGAGPAVFPGQNAKQILEAPNKLINDVRYKTLGFLPGYSRQYGEIEPVSGDTFILNIKSGEIMAGLGAPIKKEFNIQRKIRILYLDDEVRVAQFLPSEDLPDNEADENGGRSQEDIVFVFQRITADAEEKESASADDGEDGEEASKPSPFFGGGRKLESAATVAERQVRQQLKEQRGGSSKVAAVPAKPPAGGSSRVSLPAPPAPRPGTQRGTQRSRKQAEEVEEDPRERRRREQDEERARKAAEAEARAAEVKAAREKAEAERQAEREKQAAIKELLAQLSAEIKERQAEAKEAAKELRDIEKSAGAGLKEVVSARAQIDEAEADVKSVSAELDSAAAAKKEAEKAAREAKDLVVAAEKVLRARLVAAAPALPRK